jgi:hypothetical protein
LTPIESASHLAGATASLFRNLSSFSALSEKTSVTGIP